MAIVFLLAVAGVLGLSVYVLDDWGYATFGSEGWIGVSSMAGLFVGLAVVVAYAAIVGRRA